MSWKNLLIWGGLTAGTIGAFNYAPNAIANTYNVLSATTLGLIDGTAKLVSNTLWAKWLAVAWSMAPFATAGIWMYAGYKIADKMDIQSDIWKFTANTLWAGAGAVITTAIASSPLLPFALWGGVLYTGYKLSSAVKNKLFGKKAA